MFTADCGLPLPIKVGAAGECLCGERQFVHSLERPLLCVARRQRRAASPVVASRRIRMEIPNPDLGKLPQEHGGQWLSSAPPEPPEAPDRRSWPIQRSGRRKRQGQLPHIDDAGSGYFLARVRVRARDCLSWGGLGIFGCEFALKLPCLRKSWPENEKQAVTQGISTSDPLIAYHRARAEAVRAVQMPPGPQAAF